VHFTFAAGRWGFRGDLSRAEAYSDRGHTWGAVAMPHLNLTPRLQAVGRYTHIRSAALNGVRLATYESRIVSGRGDEYDELYLGANYYLYGHRLKVQTGVQWADMQDRASDGGAYSGVSWTTGLRVGW
jgi:phosphate-selective porin OprO/OprP